MSSFKVLQYTIMMQAEFDKSLQEPSQYIFSKFFTA